jgi:hypothetical protein
VSVKEAFNVRACEKEEINFISRAKKHIFLMCDFFSDFYFSPSFTHMFGNYVHCNQNIIFDRFDKNEKICHSHFSPKLNNAF